MGNPRGANSDMSPTSASQPLHACISKPCTEIGEFLAMVKLCDDIYPIFWKRAGFGTFGSHAQASLKNETENMKVIVSFCLGSCESATSTKNSIFLQNEPCRLPVRAFELESDSDACFSEMSRSRQKKIRYSWHHWENCEDCASSAVLGWRVWAERAVLPEKASSRTVVSAECLRRLWLMPLQLWLASAGCTK